jgi:hypothetical protein
MKSDKDSGKGKFSIPDLLKPKHAAMMIIEKYLIPAFKYIYKSPALRYSPYIFSLAALYFSCQANNIAKESNEEERQISKQYFEPAVHLRADISNADGSRPHIILTNEGPIKATLLELRIYELRYDMNKHKIDYAIAKESWKHDGLNPNESRAFIMWGNWLSYEYYKGLSTTEKRPIEHYILEAYLSYHRDSDLRFYQRRAFYFFDSDGHILRENDVLNNAAFSDVLAAARTSRLDSMLAETSTKLNTDILHSVPN